VAVQHVERNPEKVAQGLLDRFMRPAAQRFQEYGLNEILSLLGTALLEKAMQSAPILRIELA